MDENTLNPLDIGSLETNERFENEYAAFGASGRGWGCVVLSSDTIAELVNGCVKFAKNGKELVLTKEELINEFKVGLRTGYFNKEDLLD